MKVHGQSQGHKKVLILKNPVALNFVISGSLNLALSVILFWKVIAKTVLHIAMFVFQWLCINFVQEVGIF